MNVVVVVDGGPSVLWKGLSFENRDFGFVIRRIRVDLLGNKVAATEEGTCRWLRLGGCVGGGGTE